MKKTIILLILVLSVQLASYAQTFYGLQDKFLVSWEIAVPTNNDYLSKTSAAGGRVEYRHMIKPNLSIGIGASWNSFEQYTGRKTYQKSDGSGAVTTDVIKDIYTVPVTIGLHYYFAQPKSPINPYIGIGIGTQYSEQNAYFNIYEISEKNWGFCVRPEVGLLVPFNRAIGAYLSAAYNFSTNKNDDFNIDNLKHFAFNIGVCFGIR
jgi:outer membrane protein W